jgi:nucleoside-diphosphate kinase
VNERTLVLVKPDAVQRGLVGEVISRLEAKGLRIIAMRMIRMSKDLAQRHYAEHRDKPFFESLVSFITSGPLVAMVLEGPGAVAVVRQMIGATNPAEAAPGTIRGDHGLTIAMNVVHGSDSVARAEEEVATFFNAQELDSYRRDVDRWVLDEGGG